MACGHSANATTKINNYIVPCCVICAGTPESLIIVDSPSLEGRFAKCAYNNENDKHPDAHKNEPIPSALSLAFFEYKGEDSNKALNACKKCGYYQIAHTLENAIRLHRNPDDYIKDHEFEPHGAYEFDEYYCGCWGWD